MLIIAGIAVIASWVFWLVVSTRDQKLEIEQLEIKAEQSIVEAEVKRVEDLAIKRIEKDKNETSQKIPLGIGHHTIRI